MRQRKKTVLSIMLLLVLMPFQNCSNRMEGINAATSGSSILSSVTSVPTTIPTTVPTTTPAIPPTATPTTLGMKSIFIGSGQGFRTLMSCDDGLSWIHDQTDAGGIVGDESPGTSRGMDSGNGYFYVKYGWGSDANNVPYKGTIRRSRDGVNWDVIFTGDWGGGVAYGKDLLFTASASWDGNWQISINNGLSWSKLTDPAVTSISGIPDHPPVFRLKDKIFISGRNQKIALSYDQGRTWTLLTSGFLGDSEARSFAEGNGVILSLSFDYSTNNGTVSRSTDNGKTWTGSILGGLWSPIIFNGTEFVGLSLGKTWKSFDGLKWSTAITKIDGVDAAPWWEITAQFNPVTGTYVGISSGGQQDYDKQKAYRSKDGINWITLDATKFRGGNHMQAMIVGEIEAKYCP